MLMMKIRNQKSKISNLKVLFLSVNSSYSHSSLAYGQLRCLSEKYSPEWTWNIIECTINDSTNEVLHRIQLNKPTLVVATVYLFNRDFVLNLISKYAVLNPLIRVVLGGPEFLGNNQSILKHYPWISAVFRGDESSFPYYLNLITANTVNSVNLKQIPGICFTVDNEGYFDGGAAMFNDNLDNLPSPYVSGYYIRNKPFVQLETSRGCPSKCSFCTSSLSGKVQYYSLDRVRTDLYHIRKAGIKEVRVLDRTFNIPSDRALRLLRIFSEEFSEIKFHLEFDPSKLSDEIITQLTKVHSGQFHIETGIQTFYIPALNAINRKAGKAEEGLDKLVNVKGVEIHADLIYGLPKQTVDSLFYDLRKLILIGPEEIQVEVLKILPGTLIKDNTVLKFSPNPPYDVMSTQNMDLKYILQFSYLSKIIDSYYNIKATRSLFQFAVINDSLFLENFLLFAVKRFSEYRGKPAPSVRFKLLFDFAFESDNTILYSFILFTYLCAGFFQNPKDSSNKIKLVKRNELKEILKENPSVVWSDNNQTIDKPAYLASFDYNAADIWLNPKTDVRKGNYNYLFLLSQGGMNKRVSKIINIR